LDVLENFLEEFGDGKMQKEDFIYLEEFLKEIR